MTPEEYFGGPVAFTPNPIHMQELFFCFACLVNMCRQAPVLGISATQMETYARFMTVDLAKQMGADLDEFARYMERLVALGPAAGPGNAAGRGVPETP